VANRLASATSPYLQQHASNPVDWWAWGPEAFAEAKRRDVPVLISIGYATCHWCHVMARESFSDGEIGELVNDSMVAIKVDREEHPEVDSHYLTQAGAFIEQLGWPLTLFATPAGDVFHAATYLPPAPRGEIPSFRQTIDAVNQAWSVQREEIYQGALRLREAIKQADAEAKKRDPLRLSSEDWEAIIAHLISQEDTEFGGFGSAPKFPIAPVLEFLHTTGEPDATALVNRTLAAMAASPLVDPLEGGFFRYATKRDWSEPHYERMLYDNAQLLALYAAVGQVDVAAGIVRFFRQVMRLQTGLASAQDSESVIDGSRVEGGYYLADRATREGLSPPAIDDKVLTGWNGMAIGALAQAAQSGVEGEPLDLAVTITRELLELHRVEPGRLVRMSKDGTLSSAAATLEDYGGLAWGLLELAVATGEVEWADEARELVDACITDEGEFAVPGGGDPTVSGLDAISGDVTEGAMPSGLSLIAHATLTLHQLTGATRYREVTERSVGRYAEAVSLRPLGFGGLASVLWRIEHAMREVIVVSGAPDDPVVTEARQHTPPGWLLLAVHPDQARAFSKRGFSLFTGREQAEVPTAYVCRDGVCQLPHTSPEAVVSELTGAN
jgi:uncharacterized protein YyaL (SSP411 family)